MDVQKLIGQDINLENKYSIRSAAGIFYNPSTHANELIFQTIVGAGNNPTSIEMQILGLYNRSSYYADHIYESTSAHGVDIDGVLLKDGTIKVVDGTAAAPAIIGTTSSGAGIYFGSNVVYFATAGTSRVNIDAQGDININGGRGIEGGTTGVGTYWARFSPIAVQQALSGPGAITLTEYYTAWTSTGTGDALTLAVGKVIGQVKKIKYVAEAVAGDTGVLTLTGYTSITFTSIGDYVELMWNGTAWICTENNGCTIVA